MEVFIKNNCAAQTLTWVVEFDLPSGTSVTNSWRSVRTRSGQHYRFGNASYNGDISPGQEEHFGFNVGGLGQPVNLTVRQ